MSESVKLDKTGQQLQVAMRKVTTTH